MLPQYIGIINYTDINLYTKESMQVCRFLCALCKFLTSPESDPVNTRPKALLGAGFLLEWDPLLLIIYSNRRPLLSTIMELF